MGCHKLHGVYTCCLLLLSCFVQIGPVKTVTHVKMQTKFPKVLYLFLPICMKFSIGDFPKYFSEYKLEGTACDKCGGSKGGA